MSRPGAAAAGNLAADSFSVASGRQGKPAVRKQLPQARERRPVAPQGCGKLSGGRMSWIALPQDLERTRHWRTGTRHSFFGRGRSFSSCRNLSRRCGKSKEDATLSFAVPQDKSILRQMKRRCGIFSRGRGTVNFLAANLLRLRQKNFPMPQGRTILRHRE